jgi:5,5'-dehydrodivanillate O-demethylase
MTESDGIRCSYHGWKFNEHGECIDQPFECAVRPQGRFMQSVTIKAYRVESKAGLIWAYLGREPAPCLLDWEAYEHRGYKQLMFTTLPCNWLQCQENSIDPVHFEWLHENWSRHQRGEWRRGPTHVRIAFEEFEYGFVYRRLLDGVDDSHEMWAVGRVCLWPNALYVGGFDWTVPMDDHNTLRVRWSLHPLPGDKPFSQERIPYWYSPLVDAETGDLYTTHGTNQDYVAMVSQGRVADRTKELLGQSDRGIILMRKQFLRDLGVVAAGGDPKGLLRDAARNVRLPLPCMSAERAVPKQVRPETLAGQPREILEELRQAWNSHS